MFNPLSIYAARSALEQKAQEFKQDFPENLKPYRKDIEALLADEPLVAKLKERPETDTSFSELIRNALAQRGKAFDKTTMDEMQQYVESVISGTDYKPKTIEPQQDHGFVKPPNFLLPSRMRLTVQFSKGDIV